MWGGWNGGVVPENVSVSSGTLKLEGHGNLYTGDVQGCNKNLPGGIRTGAAIATRDYYASGCYEVVAKVAPVFGACSAIWTFEYEEYDKDSEEYKNYPDQTGKLAIVNHEIDIELPTANADFDTPTFRAARFNTYEMENRSKSHFQTLPEAVDDGQWHTYRFDWHTGDANEQARVDFYVDGQLLYTSYEHIPTHASRLWLGIWFPASKDSDGDGFGDTGWTGTADFDTAVFEIDSVRITPYCEAGDTVGNETYPKDGWAADSFPEDIEAERYEHIRNGDFSAGAENWTAAGGVRRAGYPEDRLCHTHAFPANCGSAQHDLHAEGRHCFRWHKGHAWRPQGQRFCQHARDIYGFRREGPYLHHREIVQGNGGLCSGGAVSGRSSRVCG